MSRPAHPSRRSGDTASSCWCRPPRRSRRRRRHGCRGDRTARGRPRGCARAGAAWCPADRRPAVWLTRSFSPSSLDMLLTDQYMKGVTVQFRLDIMHALADFHPYPRGTAMNDRELTLTDLLADPMILAVMAAYQVDAAALEAALSGLARKLARPAAGGGCGSTVSGAR